MKDKRKTSLFIESVVVILICITPYLLYIHLKIPENLNSVSTIFGVIKGGYFETVRQFAYWVFSKLVPILLLIILYVTNKNWWSHAILVPIATYLFQLISVVNDSAEYIDEIEFIYTLPILIVVTVPLYFIRKNLSIFIGAINLKKEMDDKMKNPK